MIDLAADEIILQIRKGNEEALELLFLLYEIHFLNIEKKMRLIYHYPYSLKEDVRMIIKKTTYESIFLYEMDKSMFFSYWRLLVLQKLHRFFDKEKQMIMIDKQKCDVDFERLDTSDYHFEQDVPTKMYFRDEYQKSLVNINDEYGGQDASIIRMWSEGYDYSEIAKTFNITINKVGYIIYKSIKHLRDKYKS